MTSLLVGWDVLSSTNCLCEEDRSLIAEISLQAHFNAQGKVGSGYDIITAIYGSCVFEKKMNVIGCSFTPFTFPSSLQISCMIYSGVEYNLRILFGQPNPAYPVPIEYTMVSKLFERMGFSNE